MTPFGPETLRERSRDMFVANECDSEQYRETQPAATLLKIGELAELFAEQSNDIEELMYRVAAWAGAAQFGGYSGAELAGPIHELYHDELWARGRHPYYETLAELQEMLDDDDTADASGNPHPPADGDETVTCAGCSQPVSVNDDTMAWDDLDGPDGFYVAHVDCPL